MFNVDVKHAQTRDILLFQVPEKIKFQSKYIWNNTENIFSCEILVTIEFSFVFEKKAEMFIDEYPQLKRNRSKRNPSNWNERRETYALYYFFLEDTMLLNRIVCRKFTPAQRITKKPTTTSDKRTPQIYNGNLKKGIFGGYPEKIEILSYIRDGKYSWKYRGKLKNSFRHVYATSIR